MVEAWRWQVRRQWTGTLFAMLVAVAFCEQPSDGLVDLGDSETDDQGAGDHALSGSWSREPVNSAHLDAKVRAARKAKLERQLAGEKVKLYTLDSTLNDVSTPAHLRSRKASLASVQSAVADVDAMLITSAQATGVDAAAEPDPVVATEELEDEKALNKEANSVEAVEALGTALGQEEQKSVIGLSLGQQSDFVMLAVDTACKAMLDHPSEESIKVAKGKLAEAQAHVRKQRIKYEAATQAKEAKTKQAVRESARQQQAQQDAMDAKALSDRAKLFQRNAALIKTPPSSDSKKKGDFHYHERAQKEQRYRQEQIAANQQMIIKARNRTYMMERNRLEGSPSMNTILESCRQLGLVPVCESYDAYDGRCVPIDTGDKNWHFTVDSEYKENLAASVLKVRGVYMYAGGRQGPEGVPEFAVVNKNPLPSTLSNTSVNITQAKKEPAAKPWWILKYNQTFCTKPVKPTLEEFEFQGIKGVRVPLEGQVSTAAIEKACSVRAPGMRPLCESYDVIGGRCLWVPGLYGKDQGLANPKSPAQTSPSVSQFFRWSAFYAASHPAQIGVPQEPVVNIGGGMQRARLTDEGGYTLCGKITQRWKSEHSAIKYLGSTLHRTDLVGTVSQRSITEECTGLGMKPVCDSFADFNGVCTLLSPYQNFRFSSPQDVARAGLEATAIAGTYWYTSGKASESALHAASKSMLSVGVANGASWCVKPANSAFTWKGIDLVPVAVKGIMSGLSASVACREEKMYPVCVDDSFFLQDPTTIQCMPFNGGGAGTRVTAMSMFANNQTHLSNARGTFLFGLRVRSRKPARMGIVTGFKRDSWSDPNRRIRDSTTLCARRSSAWLDSNREFKIPSSDPTQAPQIVRRVALPGQKADSSTIAKVCGALSMKPVCGSTSHGWDSNCVALESPDPSRVDQKLESVTQRTSLSESLLGGNWDSRIMGVNLYVPRPRNRNSYRASLYVRSGGTARYHFHGWETLCTEGREVDTSAFQMGPDIGGYKITPTQVIGKMTSATLRSTCLAAGPTVKPLCVDPTADAKKQGDDSPCIVMMRETDLKPVNATNGTNGTNGTNPQRATIGARPPSLSMADPKAIRKHLSFPRSTFGFYFYSQHKFPVINGGDAPYYARGHSDGWVFCAAKLTMAPTRAPTTPAPTKPPVMKSLGRKKCTHFAGKRVFSKCSFKGQEKLPRRSLLGWRPPQDKRTLSESADSAHSAGSGRIARRRRRSGGVAKAVKASPPPPPPKPCSASQCGSLCLQDAKCNFVGLTTAGECYAFESKDKCKSSGSSATTLIMKRHYP